MILWNEQHLEELVRKMGLGRAPGQGKVPIHQNLFVPGFPRPLLTKIMRLDASEWSALGYVETDRVSVVRYLGNLGCRTDGALSKAVLCQQPLALELAGTLIDAGACDKNALSAAAKWQEPLTLELAKLLVNAGMFDKDALSVAAGCQQPLTLELAKLLIDAGCDPAAQDGDGWDALVHLAWGGHPVDPQVTDLFLATGCRTDLGGRKNLSDKFRLRFDQILKEHAQWKESLEHLKEENNPATAPCGLDWRQ